MACIKPTYTVDTTAPTISAVLAVPTSSSATISWTTDEPATSRVDYGTNPTALTSTASVSVLTTAHAVQLSGLNSGTAYYYRVTSAISSVNRALPRRCPRHPRSS